ncbi:MAG: glycoside hydrolase family 3 C-terminal domain-containing protein [Oscillospiraceae bacterium]|nr:glycoside hydrolase family 3 C-terminal domain-containing protein [Oscillospiraceae bacterium]
MKNKKYPFQNPELSFKKRITDLISRLTLNEKITLMTAYQPAIPRLGIGEWNVGTEVARGYVGREATEYSTVFPQPIGLASTFDPELMYSLGEITGTEARIYHKKTPTSKLMMFGPTVDLLRDPRWGRNEEAYGEDPLISGELSSAYVKGMSGKHKRYSRVIPILKHFCCNNHEEDRIKDNADVDPRTLREYYYAPFETAIKGGGAYAVMTAYNELSGVPAMINPDLRKVCRDEWGMLLAVTDGGDFTQNVLHHRFGTSHAETIASAVKAGNNIMLDSKETTIAAAKEAVKKGLITEKEIDNIIKETLKARFMLGEFDSDKKNPYANTPDKLLNCADFRATNARASRECITLLKNTTSTGTSLLPINDDGKIKVAVIGQLADANYPDWYTGKSNYHVTIMKGLKNQLGSRLSHCDGCDIVAIKSLHNNKYLTVNEDNSVTATADEITTACRFKKVDFGGEVLYISEQNGKLLKIENGFMNAVGIDTFEWFGKMIIRPTEYMGNTVYKNLFRKDIGINSNNRLSEILDNAITSEKLFKEETLFDAVNESVKLAKKADYVIVVLGNNPMIVARECFDRKTLALPEAQQRLINAAGSANKNTILIINASYPYSINKEQREIPSIIYTAHGGPEGGNAMADVIFGRYNPSGRTPQTWYKHERELPDIKNYDIISSDSTYLYFKGEALYPFGHGLSYSKFEYSDLIIKDHGKTIEARLKVKNVSDIFGEEVVQLYFTPLHPRVKRPRKQLCDFIRQGIDPGKTADIVFTFDKNRLRFWDVTREKFCVETGKYRFAAASSSEDIRCIKDMKINGEKIPHRDMTKRTKAINYDNKHNIKLNFDRERLCHYIHAPEFGGTVDYFDVQLSGVKGMEVYAATNIFDGTVTVLLGEKQIGELKIPATAAPNGFGKHKCSFTEKLPVTGKLTLRLTQGTNLLFIKLTT